MKDRSKSTDKKLKLMTAKDVQEEFLCMDIRKLRAFLNQNIAYIKIGARYFYHRSEVEELLTDTENSYEFEMDTY